MSSENSFAFQQLTASGSPTKGALLAANAAGEPESPGEWSLKAHGGASKIPKPSPATPGDQCISKGLFGTPLPTPSQAGLREESLKKLELQLERKLEQEREALAKASAKADASAAQRHEALIHELSSKLSRTQETYEKLVAAQDAFAKSAKKVKSVELLLHKATADKAGMKSSKMDAAVLRSVKEELKTATEYMAAAASRVEQMESVCDMLMERLGELESSEGALRLERNALAQDLEQQQVKRQEQEAALADALELAKQGTPEGNNAKKRLPGVMDTLREMELALAAEREVAKQLKDDKAALQQRLEVQHAELVADKVRELARAQSEKNASLESLVRATAAAAKEAGKLSEEHQQTKAQLQQFQTQTTQLQAELASLQGEFAATCNAKSELVNEKAQLEKRLSIESNVRHQLKQDVLAKEAAAAALQAELAALVQCSQGDLSRARSEAAVAEQRCAELEREQEALTGVKTALEEQLVQREAAAMEMSGTVAAMQGDIARLDALNAELKAAMDAKVTELACQVTSLTAEREALEREADQASRNMEEMARQLHIHQDEFRAQAKAGTPRGEGAKIVARLAFKKIKELQGAVAEYRQAAQGKAASVASLEQTLASLEEAARQREAAVQEAESRVAQAETEAARTKAQLQEQLQEATARCAVLESASAAAAVRLAALEAELKYDKEAADEKMAELLEQVARLEGELAAAGGERAALEVQLAVAVRDAAQLSSDMVGKVQQLETLRQEMVDARTAAEVGVKEAKAALEQVAEDRDAVLSEKDTAVRQAAELQAQVEALRLEVVEAHGVGTPHGEGAKTVSRLALEKIRKMQLEAEECAREVERKHAAMQASQEELQAALDGKNLELAAIQAALEEITCGADRTQQWLQGRAAELEAGLVAATAAKVAVEQRVGELDARLQQLGDSAAAKEAELATSVAQLSAELEAASTAKEASIRELASVNMHLEIAVQQAAAKVESLQAQVDELTAGKAAAIEARMEAESLLAALSAQLASACTDLEAAKRTGTPKGEGTKEVSRLAFQRIHDLQGAVEDTKLEVAAGEERIAQLEQQVATLEEAAHGAQAMLMEHGRLQAQCKELRGSVDKFRDSDSQLQAQIISLTDQRKSLHSEVTSLSGEVESLQMTLGIVRHEANSASRALEEAQAQHEELQHSLATMQAQCAELQQGKGAVEAEVAEMGAAAEELRASLSTTTSQLEELQGEYAAFRATNEAATDDLRQRLAVAEAESERLEAARSTAADEVERLAVDLAETRAQGTPRGNAAKTTVKLAFEKICGLQQDLEEKHGELKYLEAQLDAQQDIAAQLVTELIDERKALAEASTTRQQLKADLSAAQQQLAEQGEAMSALRGQKAEVEAALHKVVADAEVGGKEAAAKVAVLEATKAVLAADLAATMGEVQAGQQHMAALEQELQAAQATFERRMADTATQGTNWQASKFQLEANLAQMREAAEGEAAARRAAEAEKQAAQGEVGRLTGRIGELNEEVESLRDTISHLGQSLANALALGEGGAEATSETEWLGMIADARSECDAMAAAKAEAEHRLAELTSQLSAALSDLEAAKMQGTPGGTAAKQVAKLSMLKLRDLQGRELELEAQVTAADRQSTQLSASLEAAQGQLLAAKVEAQARAAEVADLVERMHQQAADMQALQSKVQEEEERRKTATAQVMVLEKALAAARDEASALVQQCSAAELDATARLSPLQVEVSKLADQLAVVTAEREAAEQRAGKAVTALAAAQQLWVVQEQLAGREQELSAVQREHCTLSAEVSRLSSELLLRDKQLGEQHALLKKVAEALEGQKQTNKVSKQLHVQRFVELAKAVEQAGARSSELEQEVEALRSQAAQAAALESQNRELAAGLKAAEFAARQARTTEVAVCQAAEAAGRQLEQQASQRELELQGSLNNVSKELQEVKTRSDSVDRQLTTVQVELAQARVDFEVQRRKKHAAEVAAVVALSVLVLGGAAVAAVCRSN